jgi:Fe-S cluster assembly protein SufD
MTQRTVHKITRAGRPAPAGFPFTTDMIPASNGAGSRFVGEYRTRAWDAAQRLPMPHTALEPWRRTDLRALDAGGFSLPAQDAWRDLAPVPDSLLSPLIGDSHGGLIVLKPGGADLQLAPAVAAQGVIFTDYATAEREHPSLVEKILGNGVPAEADKFAALTGALAGAGVFLYVPRHIEVQLPLHSVSWMPGSGLAYFNHLLVYLEDGASVTYVHEAASPAESGQALHSAILEGYVGANASLRFVALQSLGGHFWNFSHERIRVARDGQVDWIAGALGSRLTKSFADLDLEGQGANGRMSGFFFTDGTQHLDLDTQQNHHAPHTTSDLLYKGALREHSRSIWQGMIYVAPGAQKTDGYQANRNLILEPTARADSIPGLEILADDVRCTHGATVGKIDPDHLFYLQARGIPAPEAERLIVEGFFAPIMDRIPYERVRDRFYQAIQDKMN